jgi:hypothetical protein
MSYGSGGAGGDLDPINFTDEAFNSFISLNPSSDVHAEAAEGPSR